MEELIYKVVNMWKKNVSFFFVAILFILFEIPYMTSVEYAENQMWYECVNYFYVSLWALPSFFVLGYILFMRAYMPKATRGTRGIAFYIVNANEKQYESITKKFIAQFKKSVTTQTSEYSVIVIDDYHSQKYYPILNSEVIDNDGREQVKILKKRRCCVAILIDCLNGGDGEKLFCHMKTKFGVSHQTLHPVIRAELVKDISIAFAPLREVDIMKLTETTDLSRHSFSMDIVFKYILASTYFHCGDFMGALKMLEAIDTVLSSKSDLPDAVVPIKNVLSNRIAICYKVQAQMAYQMFCEDHKTEHLETVRLAIGNSYCKMIYGEENKILEGICSFVLDNNVTYALQCMNSITKKDPVIKFNKAFLLLYSNCTTKNVGRTYNAYKNFGNLPSHVQDQIEAFTYYEYNKNINQRQLLLILFFIYDYQENSILAKRCLEQFCSAFPWIVNSSEVSSIFKGFKKRYADVEYVEGEVYSI